jgi:hypothetical protein
MQRKHGRYLLNTVLLVLIAWGIWCVFGWDPKFSDQSLIGLSPDEAIARLGPPSYDPRVESDWESDKSFRPLALGYYGPAGQTYVLEFKNDKLASVRRAMK